MSYLPLGSAARIQFLEFQESLVQSPGFDSEVLITLKQNPNRWVLVKDKNGDSVVARWLDPSIMSPLQKSQYGVRSNCGWFDTIDDNRKG